MRVIGLTGGIASGKSTVARFLERRGVAVIDADQLSRDSVAPGETAHCAIVDAFGKEILNKDHTINRIALGKLVFSNPEARHLLESITHPAIARLAEARLAELRVAGVPLVVYMAPLLIEAGAVARVDEIWVVYIDQETQIKRVMARDGVTREEALLKIGAQMPMEEKRRYGSVVIDNRGTMEELEEQLKELWEKEFNEATSGSAGK